MSSNTHQVFAKLENKDKKHLLLLLEQNYGVSTEFLNQYYFFITGKEKVYISTFDPNNLGIYSINSFGLYFGTYHLSDKFRLSIEGSQLITPQKNYIVLYDLSLASYLAAENLFEEDISQISNTGETTYLIVRYGEENLGCVSYKQNYYLTYVPKSRKLDYNKVF